MPPPSRSTSRRWLLAALIALALYPFAPWESGAAVFVGVIGATMGPFFGVMMVDYYLIRKGEMNVEDLYREDGEFRFHSGWHVNAFIAAGIGALFSSILPNFTNGCRNGGVSMAGSSASPSPGLSTTPFAWRGVARAALRPGHSHGASRDGWGDGQVRPPL